MKPFKFISLAFSFLLLLLQFNARADGHDLLAISAHTIDTSKWGDANAWSRFGGEVYWLSDREALCFENLKSDYKAEFAQHDVVAGIEERLKAAGDFFSSTDAYPWTIKMSPDRQWLLWPTESGFAGVKTNGIQSYAIQIPKPGGRRPVFMDRVRANFCWLSDSHHWVEFEEDNSRTITRTIVRNVERPDEMRVLAVPQDSPIIHLPSDSFGYPTSAGPGISSRDNLFIVTDWLDANSKRKTVARLDLQGDRVRVTKQETIDMPAGWTFSNMTFSPQCDRIVWKLIKEKPENAINPAHPDQPSRFPKRKQIVSLWISDIDGGRMREIGEMEAGELAGEPDREILLQPDYVRWMPDGKAISFMYKGKIYILSSAA